MVRAAVMVLVTLAAVRAARAEPSKEELLSAETNAFAKAKPVFDKYCAKCHVKGGAKATAAKLKHFDMSSYPFAGHHAAEWGPKIRQQLGIGGGKAKMPSDKPGVVQGDELALIEAWSRAWDAAQAAGAHPPSAEHDHHHHD